MSGPLTHICMLVVMTVICVTTTTRDPDTGSVGLVRFRQCAEYNTSGINLKRGACQSMRVRVRTRIRAKARVGVSTGYVAGHWFGVEVRETQRTEGRAAAYWLGISELL